MIYTFCSFKLITWQKEMRCKYSETRGEMCLYLQFYSYICDRSAKKPKICSIDNMKRLAACPNHKGHVWFGVILFIETQIGKREQIAMKSECPLLWENLGNFTVLRHAVT